MPNGPQINTGGPIYPTGNPYFPGTSDEPVPPGLAVYLAIGNFQFTYEQIVQLYFTSAQAREEINNRLRENGWYVPPLSTIGGFTVLPVSTIPGSPGGQPLPPIPQTTPAANEPVGTGAGGATQPGTQIPPSLPIPPDLPGGSGNIPADAGAGYDYPSGYGPYDY